VGVAVNIGEENIDGSGLASLDLLVNPTKKMTVFHAIYA